MTLTTPEADKTTETIQGAPSLATPPVSPTSDAHPDMGGVVEGDLLSRVAADPQGTVAYIKRLRDENRTYRKSREAVERASAEAEGRSRTQEEIAKSTAQEYDKLKSESATTAAELESLKSELASMKRYKEAVAVVLAGRLEALGEEAKKRVPDFGDDAIKTLAWVEANLDWLSPRKAPNLNPGQLSDAPDPKAEVRRKVSESMPKIRL